MNSSSLEEATEMSSTYTRLLFHIVVSTKQRLPLSAPELKDDLPADLGGIVKTLDGFPDPVGGIEDHVQLLISIPQWLSLADVVRTIKANSSKWDHERRKLDRFHWQSGYSAVTVSESVRPAVIKYIQNQADHHRREDFPSELRALLFKHGIEFDVKYLWE